MKRTKIERILCPVDFSEFSIGAYAFATSLARRCRARLFVQHVTELWQYPSASFAVTADDYERFCTRVRSDGGDKLRSFVESHAISGVEPECVTGEGMAADSILCFAKQNAIDLIVMGTHGYRGFERWMLGSVTEKVLRMARCQVLAVPQLPSDFIASATSENEINLHRIVVGADFSDSSNEALDYAISLAEEYDAGLTVIHVLEEVASPGCAEDPANAYKRLDELLREKAKRTSRIATEVRIGRAYREISQFARDDHAELVVMAVHGRNSLDDAVFGSTTYRVIQSGVCPVLAIHHEAQR
jgi:nucleotide-binding universal stress UspA family protein